MLHAVRSYLNFGLKVMSDCFLTGILTVVQSHGEGTLPKNCRGSGADGGLQALKELGIQATVNLMMCCVGHRMLLLPSNASPFRDGAHIQLGEQPQGGRVFGSELQSACATWHSATLQTRVCCHEMKLFGS